MSRRPTVLIWYWGRFGGGPQVVELLVDHLLATGFAGRLALSLSAQNERAGALAARGLEVHPVETFEGQPSLLDLARRGLRFRRQFSRTLAQVRPDVILAPMLFGALPLLSDIARRNARKLIYVVHDAKSHSGDEHGLGQQFVQRLMVRLADEVVAMSDAQAAVLNAAFPAARPKVSVEALTGLYAPLRPSRPAPDRPVRFLVPGRVVRYKGYERLARALALVEAEIAVTITGEGPYRAEVERLFSGDRRVTLALGWRTPAAHAALYGEHDILLCPYDDASQSALVCEALAAAMPAVVTPVGALPEQSGFGRAGVVLDDLDPRTLARAITAIAGGAFDYAGASRACAEVLREASSRLTWAERLGEG